MIDVSSSFLLFNLIVRLYQTCYAIQQTTCLLTIVPQLMRTLIIHHDKFLRTLFAPPKPKTKPEDDVSPSRDLFIFFGHRFRDSTTVSRMYRLRFLRNSTSHSSYREEFERMISIFLSIALRRNPAGKWVVKTFRFRITTDSIKENQDTSC